MPGFLVRWAIVALAELAASRAERRRELLLLPPVPAQPAEPDAAWFSPPVEHTLLAGAEPAEPQTAVTRLPAPVEEQTVEERPAR